jgi:hypothetical protein
MNTNYEKEFVLYEQALALKELGFDEPCFGNYKKTHKELEKSFYCYNSDYVDYNEDYIAAPLYQQVFRWFREKYNLKSWVEEHTADTFIYEIRPHVLTQYKQGETYVYTNYEEAELECLKKLIEIVKEEKL